MDENGKLMKVLAGKVPCLFPCQKDMQKVGAYIHGETGDGLH
jgi:hypothetical protein